MDRADSNGPDLQAGLAAEGEGALGKGFGFVGVLGFNIVGEVLLSWGWGGWGQGRALGFGASGRFLFDVLGFELWGIGRPLPSNSSAHRFVSSAGARVSIQNTGNPILDPY